MMYGRLIVLAVLAHGQTNTAVPYSYSYNSDEPTSAPTATAAPVKNFAMQGTTRTSVKRPTTQRLRRCLRRTETWWISEAPYMEHYCRKTVLP